MTVNIASFHLVAGVDFSQLIVIMLIIMMKANAVSVEYCAIAIHWKKVHESNQIRLKWNLHLKILKWKVYTFHQINR